MRTLPQMGLCSVVLLALLALIAAEIRETGARARLDTRTETSKPETLRRDSRAIAEEDSHGHLQSVETAETACAVSRMQLLQAFNEVSLELNVTGEDGHICSLPVPECRHHDGEEYEHHDNDDNHRGDNEEHAHNDGSGSADSVNGTCWDVYTVCEDLIIHTNLVSSSCLSEDCSEDDHTNSTSTDGRGTRPSTAEAYGYGFLMVCLVSLGSLLGIVVVPLLLGKDKSRKKTLVYKYVYFFMIALGTSALLCDAVLHLLPHAWDLHAHDDSEDTSHSHGNSHGKTTVEEFVWKGSAALLALYLFYILEFLLHGFISHTHSHGFPTDTKTDCHDDSKDCIQLEASVPHGECGGTSSNARILHPAGSSPSLHVPEERGRDREKEKHPESKGKGVKGRLKRIKPLAWLIIVGDGLHKVADGLALGATISQSLTLGVSTAIALVFHEIPHEFGDYMILLSTGLTWYSALLLNFISALSGVIGFFVGVAIGTGSEKVNGWILAFAAGLFIYIALVDLLPELIHSKEKGRHRWGLFIAANAGFFVSFLALFLLAVYEEDLNTLI